MDLLSELYYVWLMFVCIYWWQLFILMFDDNFHICMIYGIGIKSINQSINQCPSHCRLLCQGMTDFFLTKSQIISWPSVEESFPGWSAAPSDTADEVAIVQWLHMNAQKWLWCRLWLCGLWFRVVPQVKFATEGRTVRWRDCCWAGMHKSSKADRN